ncbi:MAG: hypothetical protein HY676_04660 [Chloroflexi bacterium]|nr:hypothetical protein [Chloroflexota bacterium]
MKSSTLPLEDGARIAIVGGGPAGCFFAHFALKLAREKGLKLEVAIFDGKDFHRLGPPGCNMCAGVLAANFVQDMKEAGFHIHPEVVQRYIEGYCLETRAGNLYLHPPPGTSPICTVYRGSGPRGSVPQRNVSFDDFLLEHVRSEGATIVPRYVQDIILPQRPQEPARLITGPPEDARTYEAELIVGAFGLHTRLTQRMAQLDFGYRPPDAMPCVQAEVWLGAEHIQSAWGNYIYVYELKTPRVKFAAITPKRDFLTVTLIGPEVTAEDVDMLFNHPEVRRRLPRGWEMASGYCHCRPSVAASPCRRPFTDRLVIVGDASNSRLYKNGLESSYFTGKAAAESALNHGVSAKDFQKHYYPTCRSIARDAFYGRLLFLLHDYLFSGQRLTAAFLEAARAEGGSKGSQRIRELGWSMLTGDRPYGQILRHMLSPSPYLSLARAAWATSRKEEDRG